MTDASVAPEIARARRLAKLLDEAIELPGKGAVGADAIIGLIPWVGDAIGTVLSGYVVYAAARAGVGLGTLARMVANLVVDQMVGSIPILGDLFDLAFKANSRNVKLLDRMVGGDSLLRPRSAGRVLLIVTCAALVLALTLVGSLILGLVLLHNLMGALLD